MGSGATVAAGGTQIVFAQPVIDQAGSTADSGVYRDCRHRAVQLAGAALHAIVAKGDNGLLPLQNKDLMRTDLQAATAADADFFL